MVVDVRPPARDSGILVDLDTQSVSGAMTERMTQSGSRQRIASCRVDVEARPLRCDRGNRPIMSGADGAEDLACPIASRTNRNGPGEVDAV